MIVLDTNVLSELLREAPHPRVLRWVDAQRSAELTVTAITVAELRAGVAMLPRGRRRAALAERIESILQDAFGGEALAFDVGVTSYYADVVATRRRSGLPIQALDAEIAAICQRYAATLATRSIDDFSHLGVLLVNPWAEQPPPPPAAQPARASGIGRSRPSRHTVSIKTVNGPPR